jgi:GNAT superfamily N-acetyltransferase
VKLSFHALTPDRWDDLEELFGPRGAAGGCWCMCWRLTSAEWKASDNDANRKSFRSIVKRGHEPGILAYEDDEPIAWCAVAPREVYRRLENSRTLKPLDDQPVWSVSCFFVKRGHRNKGLSVKLLAAVKAHVRKRGGRLIEGYPTVTKGKRAVDAFAWTGFIGTFEKAGFEVAARPSASRAIVRLKLVR